MPGSATIPLNFAEAHSRVASEGHRGLLEFIVSLHADLLEIKAKFDTHTHAGAVAVPAVGERPTIGTVIETAPAGPFNLPGTNGV